MSAYEPLHSGKVRDLYTLRDRADPRDSGKRPDGALLMVASDRISAYDVILPTPIPDKGRILTRLSLWWFDQLADLVPNHVLSTDVPAEFAGRAVICRRLVMFPVECVARGYLAGSGLTEYAESGAVCGVGLPPGLVEGSELPEPIYTPATKAALGEHDQNISLTELASTVGAGLAHELRRLTLAVYGRARDIARSRGIVVADTKLEFGRDPVGAPGDGPAGTIVLADEVLTPDSSRFWPVELWRPGAPQASFDKQYVRDWLSSPASGWRRDSGDPPPELPDEVVEQTRSRYVEAYERLTGDTWR